MIEIPAIISLTAEQFKDLSSNVVELKEAVLRSEKCGNIKKMVPITVPKSGQPLPISSLAPQAFAASAAVVAVAAIGFAMMNRKLNAIHDICVEIQEQLSEIQKDVQHIKCFIDTEFMGKLKALFRNAEIAYMESDTDYLVLVRGQFIEMAGILYEHSIALAENGHLTRQMDRFLQYPILYAACIQSATHCSLAVGRNKAAALYIKEGMAQMQELNNTYKESLTNDPDFLDKSFEEINYTKSLIDCYNIGIEQLKSNVPLIDNMNAKEYRQYCEFCATAQPKEGMILYQITGR